MERFLFFFLSITECSEVDHLPDLGFMNKNAVKAYLVHTMGLCVRWHSAFPREKGDRLRWMRYCRHALGPVVCYGTVQIGFDTNSNSIWQPNPPMPGGWTKAQPYSGGL